MTSLMNQRDYPEGLPAHMRRVRPAALPDLPPTSELPAEISDTVAAYSNHLGELSDLRKHLTELKGAEESAKRQDAEAYAAALKSGSKDPGAKAVQQRRKDLDETERKVSGLVIVLTELLDEIRDTAATHREDWKTAKLGEIAELRSIMAEAVATYETTRPQLEQALRMAYWLARPAQDGWRSLKMRPFLNVQEVPAAIDLLRAEAKPVIEPTHKPPRDKRKTPIPTVEQIKQGTKALAEAGDVGDP